jgi:hypothetical protein
MQEKNRTNLYLILVLVQLIVFTWYYVTLPGSKLSPDKKHPQPSVKSALMSYLIYLLPMMVLLSFLNSKDKNCAALRLYVNSTCNV